jgi:hypothetical protein
MAVKPTRSFNHATQKKATKIRQVLLAIQSRDISATALQDLLDCSASSIRSIVDSLLQANIITDIDPMPRKSLYRISAYKMLVTAKLKELDAILAVELEPMKADRHIKKPKTVKPMRFRHSELHMRLFYTVYKNFISQ